MNKCIITCTFENNLIDQEDREREWKREGGKEKKMVKMKREREKEKREGEIHVHVKVHRGRLHEEFQQCLGSAVYYSISIALCSFIHKHTVADHMHVCQ